MPTAKAILYKRYKSKDDTFPVVIRLIDGRAQRFFNTGYKLEEKYWSDGEVKKHEDAALINEAIAGYLSQAKTYFGECKRSGKPVNLDLAFATVKSYNLLEYLQHRERQHTEAGQIEMEYKVRRYIKELAGCFGLVIYFSDVNADFLRKYENFLIKQGNGANTRAKKFEFLGKYFGNAIKEGKAEAPNPFREYRIKTTPVKKEKLSLEQIKAIEELKLKEGLLMLARDMFLFSYYCKGIRFQTVITMPKTAVANDRLYFETNKGNKHMSTRLHPKLKAIVDRYINNDTDTIFGRLNLSDIDTPESHRSVIGSENALINKQLKSVAKLAEIPIKISMHHARHSLAFHMKKVSTVAAIQDTLGHSRSQITEVYLKELDDEYLDSELSKIYGQ